ncbi:hypothetical protein OEZ86_001474 [Tetradesmus obliquus]|nr:hypothetical protein OEZ86_001474 [Tetradesmus obliquus]
MSSVLPEFAGAQPGSGRSLLQTDTCLLRIRPTVPLAFPVMLGLNEVELYNAAGTRLEPGVLTAQQSSAMIGPNGPYSAAACVNGLNSNTLVGELWTDLCHLSISDNSPWFKVTYPCSETLKKVVVQGFKDEMGRLRSTATDIRYFTLEVEVQGAVTFRSQLRALLSQEFIVPPPGNCAVQISATAAPQSGTFIALNEVELYNAAGSRVSWVSGQSSSVYEDYTAGACVNGISSNERVDGRWADLCHTAEADTNPSLTFGYPCSEAVSSVVIRNYQGSDGLLHPSGRTLNRFTLEVLGSGGPMFSSPLQSVLTQTITVPPPACQVLLRLTNPAVSDYLNLNEVMLFGPRMSQQIPASQLTYTMSSTWDGSLLPASNCFDGNNDTTCHSGQGDTTPVRLRVTYPCSKTLQKVVVVNRPSSSPANEAMRINAFMMQVVAFNGTTTFQYMFGGGKEVYDIQVAPFAPNPSCGEAIPACAPNRCTTRIVSSRTIFVCLRCQAGHQAITGADGASIIQCGCRAGTFSGLKNGTSPTAKNKQYECSRCLKGSYCPGWKKVDEWTVDPGAAVACNPEGATNNGLDTKVEGATRPSDCLATGGYVLPSSFGQQAIKCTGPSYAPGPYNRLKQCLPCPSGFGAPDVDVGLHIHKAEVCQVPPGRFLEGGVVRECPWGLYRPDSVPLDDKRAVACKSCPTGWTTTIKGATSTQACNKLLPGFMVANYTAGDTAAALPADLHASGAAGTSPTATAACPLGFYNDGANETFACVRCPGGSITQETGSKSINDCLVPPGYFVNNGFNLPRLAKCSTDPSTGQGYYRAGWVAAGQASGPDAAAACTACGRDIPSALVEPDESSVTLGQDDTRPGFVSSSASSCYILPGWGMAYDAAATFNNATTAKMMGIKPCPAGTYGVANITFGLANSPCKSCTKGLKSNPGSTSFKDCKNPAGFSYSSEGANQCPDNHYATKGAMTGCVPCPEGRITAYIPGDGSVQASIHDCKVPPGYGVYSIDAVDVFAPTVRTASLRAGKCPVGYFNLGDAPEGQRSRNPACAKCPGNMYTSMPGQPVCDVCAPGYGIPSSKPNSQNTSDCEPCEGGTYSTGNSLRCSACPPTTFNYPNAPTYVSNGITFNSLVTGIDQCVPRHTQLPAPAGARLGIDDSLLTTDAAAQDLVSCLGGCGPEKCCIVQWEAPSSSCKRAELAPVGPGFPGAKLFYKLPPSVAIATASISNTQSSTSSSSSNEVSAKTRGSTQYARCAMAGAWATLAAAGKVGTATSAELVEQEHAVSWGECDSETSCEALCSAAAACWGYMHVPGKGWATRGGEDQIGTRSFFVSPDFGAAAAAGKLDAARAAGAVCPPGRGGLFFCQQRCPAGYWQDGQHADCVACPEGKTSASGSTAASDCVPAPVTKCPPGYGGAPSCSQQCQPGTFQDGSAGSCQQCPDGDIAPQPGAAACSEPSESACDPGFGTAPGAASICSVNCRALNPPRYQDGTGQTCEPCPAGKEPNLMGTACVARGSSFP